MVLKGLTLVYFITSLCFTEGQSFQPTALLNNEDPYYVLPAASQSQYDDVLQSWLAEGAIINHGSVEKLQVQDALTSFSISNQTENYGAFLQSKDGMVDDTDVLIINQGSSAISYTITVATSLLYELHLDMFVIDQGIRDVEIAVQINQAFPYLEAQQMLIHKQWSTPHTFETDRFENEIMPRATLDSHWRREPLRDSKRLQADPLLFRFTPGVNTITLYRMQGSFLLGNVYLKPRQTLPTYPQYLAINQGVSINHPSLLTYQAEHLTRRNSLLARLGTHRDPSVTPFSLIEGKLNVIDGATYKTSGQQLTYTIEAPTTAMYYITLKILQNRINTVSYRRLTINGDVPFTEAHGLSFPFARGWVNHTLSNDQGIPYMFYLPAGSHTLGLEVNSAPAKSMYYTLSTLMDDINTLSLDIRKITGNNIDASREWDLLTYLPNIETQLDDYVSTLDQVKTTWITTMQSSRQSDVLASLDIARKLLVDLRLQVNLIPRRILTLSGSSGSVLYRLGVILPLLIESPLTIDQFYLHGEQATLPSPTTGFFRMLWVGIQRFFASFFSDQFRESRDPDEVTVWVSRSRQYVNLLQQMIDAEFTPTSGIKVRVSINPNEDKLILASSSGKQPDIAMGIAGWRPYDFAIRNNVYDLTTFSDFREVSTRFYPGSFMQLIYQNGVYGIPETQNFYLLFYRKDIMNRLNLEIPDTWNDVLGILPELQRFGMNFYSMLSTTNAFKAYVLTMPFIRQFGGEIFSSDGLQAGYDDPRTIAALSFMTELYTTYSLPLEVGSFYNEFRYGRLPIGIGDFGMYISLLHAAPEIAGLWDIAPLPGVLRDGQINRSFDGASTSAMIFKNTTKPQQSWQFLKWWTAKQTQLDYAENLIASYGPEYMWNTSNREAFADMSWDASHRQTILAQWQWIFDTAKTPASYMVERELSNIWNRVVYQGINLRTAIEDSLIVSNKEIIRKMIEFKFIDEQGNVLKPFILPTPETLHQWVGLVP
jgi:ABC-type glycerol-3-phosphate transport system substrate-binding protein